MSIITETILAEYEQYLDKIVPLRKKEYAQAAKKIALLMQQNKTASSAENIQQLKNTNAWMKRKVDKFLFFLSIKGMAASSAKPQSKEEQPVNEYHALFSHYEKACGKTQGTLALHENYYGHFAKYLNTLGISKASGVSARTIESFKEYLYCSRYGVKKLHYSALFQRKCLEHIKRFFAWLHQSNYLPCDPARKVKLQRRSCSISLNFLTPAEMEQLFMHASGKTIYDRKNAAALYLACCYGLRVSEVTHLLLSDIDFSNGYIHVRNSKHDADRTLPLISVVRKILCDYLERIRPVIMHTKIINSCRNSCDDVLFPSHNSKGMMYIDTLERYFNQAKERAGIKKKVTFHSLRYSCATSLFKTGMGIRYVQKLLGHKDIDTTGSYTKIFTDDLRVVLQTYHPRAAGQTVPNKTKAAMQNTHDKQAKPPEHEQPKSAGNK